VMLGQPGAVKTQCFREQNLFGAPVDNLFGIDPFRPWLVK